MKVEEISIEDYRKRYGKKPPQVKSEAAEKVPRAPRQEATGLWPLIERGWSIQSPDAIQYRLYVIGKVGFDTGVQPSELAACLKAKELERCQ